MINLKCRGLVIVLLFWGYFSNAQDIFGALNSNYSPTNSVHINPSSMLDAKTWLDIHLVGVGSYTNNDFIAAENTTLLRLRNSRTFDAEYLFFRQNPRFYHVYNRNFVQVLGAVLSQGDHAFGLSFNGYTYTDVRRVDNTVARIIEDGITGVPIDPLLQHSLTNFRINALSYGEAKLSYAYTFKKTGNEMFMLGASLKKIFPVVGGGLKIHELNYNVFDDSLLVLNNFQGDFMVNTQPEFSFNGGVGFDIGFTYQKMYDQVRSYYPNSRKNGCSPKHYKYKIGVAINDLGYAKFNPDVIEYYGYQESNLQYLLQGSSDIDDIINQISGAATDGLIRQPHKVSLPTTIAIQLDYNILPHFLYVNASWIHGIPPTKGAFGPRRAHSLSVTPRFESKWFDAALPISLYEYQYPQIGLSTRLYILTIGTDKLLNFFVPSNVYGADIYAMVKIPVYRNPKCKNRGRSGGFSRSGKKRKKKHVPCDAYR